MAGKSGTIHATLLIRACRRGNRPHTVHANLSTDELTTLTAWCQARGLTRSQGMRYLILAAGAFNATPKHQHRTDGATTPLQRTMKGKMGKKTVDRIVARVDRRNL